MGLNIETEIDLSDLDLQSLRVVRAIAEHGSITAAATLLGFSQPAVSQQLRRLEGRIGMPVVERLGRGVRLTDAGHILARHAVTIDTALSAASGELGEARGLRTGRLRLASVPTASSTIVTRLLVQLSERHPGVRVHYVESEPPETISAIRNGAVDIGITVSYPGDGDEADPARTSGLTTVELCRDEMLMAVPADDPAALAPHVDLAQMAGQKWIAGCPLCRGHLLSVCSAAGFSPRIGYETDNFVAVLNMVAAGLGVALVPQLILATAAIPDGVALVSTSPPTYRAINVVHSVSSDRVPANALALRLLSGQDFGTWGLTAPPTTAPSTIPSTTSTTTTAPADPTATER